MELSWSSWSLIDESESEAFVITTSLSSTIMGSGSAATPFDEIVKKIWRNREEKNSSFKNAIFSKVRLLSDFF